MTRQQMKSLAKLQIEGKIGSLFLISLVVGLIAGIGSGVPVISFLSVFILTPAMSLGQLYIYFRVAADPHYKPRVKDVFDGFDHFWPFFKVTFLISLFTALWSLLFIVPGIIKGIAYSQAVYIIAENPNMPAMEALRQSEAMMNGKKMDYFVLGLSFIGWALLAIPTLGLIAIWLEPYMQMTMINFYSDLKSSTNWYNPWGAPPPPPPPPFGEQF